MRPILLIEDDLDLADSLHKVLSNAGYDVTKISDGNEAIPTLKSTSFQLIIIDWGLPNKAGIDIVRELRNEGRVTPVIFLTGKSDIASKETGLDAGADDYLIKPFSSQELLARIAALLRRPAFLVGDKLEVGTISLDRREAMACCGEVNLDLTAKEFALLEFLSLHPNQPFTAGKLLSSVWPSATDSGEETVRTWIFSLRKKLSKVGEQNLLITLDGGGYLLKRENVP